MTHKEPSLLARWLLWHLAEGHLPSSIARIVHERVRRNPTWARWYHLVRRAEVEAATEEPGLSQSQMAMLQSMVLDHPSLAPATRRAPRLAVGLSLAAAAAGLFIVVSRPGGDGDFVARGDGDVRVRVRCVVGGATVSDVEAKDVEAKLQCQVDGLLVVSATNTSDHEATVVVELVGADGGTLRPLPHLALAAGVVDHLNDEGIKLDGAGTRRLRLVSPTGERVSPDVVIEVGEP